MSSVTAQTVLRPERPAPRSPSAATERQTTERLAKALGILIEAIGRQLDERSSIIDNGRLVHLVILSPTLAVMLTNAALSHALSGRRLIGEAHAAIVAVLPSDRETPLRGLDAWVQQPGDDAVCGEVEVDVSGRDGGPGGWRAFSPQIENDVWRIGVNPTDVSAADQERCGADMRRPPVGDGSERARDAEIMRHCSIAASTFWTDNQITCAGRRAAD